MSNIDQNNQLKEMMGQPNDYARVLLDATPLACVLLSNDFEPLDCNEEAVRLFKVPSKEALLKRFFNMFPIYQPSGEDSLEMANEYMRIAAETGFAGSDFSHIMSDGTLFETYVVLRRISVGEINLIAAYIRDVREEKRLMKEMYRRANFLNTNNRMAANLLNTAHQDSIDENIIESLELVGKCTNTHRVQLWKNVYVGTEMNFTIAFEWLSDEGQRKPHVLPGTKIPYAAVPEWEKRFLRGEYINGPLFTLSQTERDLLSPYEIKSVVAAPLFLRNHFWGFLSLDDCAQERFFTSEEVSILSNAGSMMVSAMDQHEQSIIVHEALRLTKLMIDTTPLACILWNKDHELFECNKEALHLYQVPDFATLNERFFDLCPKYQEDGQETDVMIHKSIDHAFQDGRYVYERTHLLLDGTEVPVEVTLISTIYKKEAIVASYLRDLRESKKAEDDLNKAMADLEKSVMMEREANNAKTTFLAKMSHEMRTPLNVIIGLSEMFLKDGAAMVYDDIESSMEKVFDAGKDMLHLVNDILDVSKIEAGRLELMPENYDVASMLNEVITQNMFRIAGKPIRFVIEIVESLPAQLFGDDVRIKQVISNLLSNAFKYTIEGEIHLSLYCKKEQESVRVTISVHDTGVGIREEDQARIFSDFEQIEEQVDNHIEGAGLGLPITKHLVELMNGTVTVESEYGRGSLFTVVLHQAYVSDEVIGAEVAESLKNFTYSAKHRKKKAKIDRIQLPNARVLIVDDNPTNLDVAKGVLKPYGMQVDCLTGGRQAIESIKNEDTHYHAIFMDHMMPEVDGIEAAKGIREDIGTEYAKAIPIIALTANVTPESEQKFLGSGFQAFLPKPINLKKLDEIIHQWIVPQL